MLSDWVLTLKNLLLPIFCQECGARLLTEENGYFCPTCWELASRIERPFCTLCGRPHTGAVGLGTRSNFPCGRCIGAKRKPPYDRAFGAARYDGVMEDAVKLLKFEGKRRLAPPLGEMMREFAEEELECGAYDFLIPVPLHRIRQRARGFNQSLLLAEAVLPAFPNARIDESLQRIRPTRTQSLIEKESVRKANIKDAFSIEGGAHLKGRTVLLIDDVVTTGGTVGECARVLRKAGASVIHVFAATLAVPEAG